VDGDPLGLALQQLAHPEDVVYGVRVQVGDDVSALRALREDSLARPRRERLAHGITLSPSPRPVAT
jgi:hypothetical protein